MKHKQFIHELPNGQKAKFTIYSEIQKGEKYYFALIIDDENADSQKGKNGMRMSCGTGKTIYYSDPDKFEKDIKEKYGTENELQSEI